MFSEASAALERASSSRFPACVEAGAGSDLWDMRGCVLIRCDYTSRTTFYQFLLQAIHSQVENSNWEWMPWKRVLSEDAILEMKSRRAQAPAGGQHDLVHALESIAGVFHEK